MWSQGPRQIDEKVRDTTGNPDGIPGWTKTTPTDFERVNRLLLRSPPDRGACVKMKKQITERIAVRTRVVRVGGAEGTKKIFTRTWKSSGREVRNWRSNMLETRREETKKRRYNKRTESLITRTNWIYRNTNSELVHGIWQLSTQLLEKLFWKKNY